MKWKNLRMPDEIVWDREAMTGMYGKLVAEPLERGYGVTIGNSLRRVLLSSLQGAAATGVKIDDVLHEFSVVEGVTEDVAELILNIKQLNLRLHSDGPETLVLDADSEGEVRSSNCLRDAGIKTLGDLVRKTEAEMLKYRNFGRKSLQELVDILADMGLQFGMDVDALLEPGRGSGDEEEDESAGETFEEMLDRMSGPEDSEGEEEEDEGDEEEKEEGDDESEEEEEEVSDEEDEEK